MYPLYANWKWIKIKKSIYLQLYLQYLYLHFKKWVSWCELHANFNLKHTQTIENEYQQSKPYVQAVPQLQSQ